MRGLIYREFYLMKKNLIFEAAVLIGIILLEVLVLLSLRFGNMSRMDDVESSKSVYFSLFLVVNTIAAFGVLVSDNGVIISDYKAKWHLYSYTLPASERLIAGIKLGKITAGMIIAFVISIANMLMEMAIIGEPFDIVYVYYMLFFGLFFLLIACITIPLTYYFKSEKAAFGVISVCYVVLMLIITRVMAAYTEHYRDTHPDIDENELDTKIFTQMLTDAKALLKTWGWTLPVLIIAIIAASYFATVKVLKRRVV